jgi:hypothetical protein
MNAPFKRRYAAARSGNAGASGMRMALDCARSVYEADHAGNAIILSAQKPRLCSNNSRTTP